MRRSPQDKLALLERQAAEARRRIERPEIGTAERLAKNLERFHAENADDCQEADSILDCARVLRANAEAWLQ